MENTPQSCQRSSDSSYFDLSRSLYESTPNAESGSTPNFTISRKRKASCIECYNTKRLADVIESCPSSPQFSSTFNESLTNNLEKFHIQSEESFLNNEGDNVTEKIHTNKLFKINGSNKKKVRSAPNTPEKQVSARDAVRKVNTSGFIKNFAQINVQSPLNKEAYGILYPDLPCLEPLKKPLTPKKFKESLEKNSTPAKKCLFTTSPRELFKKIITNNIIMSNIFRHLSDGDLYRLSMVSKSLKGALTLDMKAYDRYMKFRVLYNSSKENYRITPPGSPEKDDNVTEASPGSKNFYYFCDIASELNKNQSLVKCPRCNKASVVENFIGQCQDINSCGYIFCQKCNSFAHNPKDFKDKCNNAQLMNINNRSRNRLGDLSNCTNTSDYVTDGSSSFFSSSSLNLSSSKYDSSGFYSEFETNMSVRAVTRNLSKSFTSPSEVKPRALSCSNVKVSMHKHRTQRRTSVLPVVQTEHPTKIIEILEPSSPPKIRPYSACSKESKRNLKRLTR